MQDPGTYLGEYNEEERLCRNTQAFISPAANPNT